MGNRRPQLQIVPTGHPGGPASPEEAAAVIAAIERFLRDHTPALAPASEPVRRWARAALLEGTGREPDMPSAWGDPVPWR